VLNVRLAPVTTVNADMLVRPISARGGHSTGKLSMDLLAL
jgi:hypothetical protein